MTEHDQTKTAPARKRAYEKPSLARRDMLPAITADQVLISGITDSKT